MDSRLNAFLERAESVLARLEPLLPALRPSIDWTQCLAARWQREGRSGFLLPLEVSLDMRLTDLIGVDKQLEQLGRNTRQFLDGLPANHALLWGSRGTGKSSLVRALLAEHAKGGLRLIEIERDHLADLPRVVEQVAKLPQRFVLFCDDLSFEAGEGDYRVLKSVLDGSLEQAPDNVLLYATSNRRHLVPEKESDNENWKRVDGELHPFAGETQIFITPGYRIRSVDAMVTNFHLPESTLLMMISAFAGKQRVFDAYAHAIAGRYRFFSYGDAMLLFPQPDA